MQADRNLLQEHSLKSTPARLAILRYLNEKKLPLDAETIYEHLLSEHASVDKVTIYRILDVFYDKGIIQRLELGEGKYRYEITRGDHHHLICERCGSIEDIAECSVVELTQSLAASYRFQIRHHSLEFFGVCIACQR